MSVRRSSRLKDKEEKAKIVKEARRKKFKRVRGIAADEDCSNSSDNYSPSPEESSDEANLLPVVIVTPRKKVTPQRSNDYLKVYHSYNRDNGLDLYEGEFIDDTDVPKRSTPSRQKKKPAKRKPLRLGESDKSSSDDDEGSGAAKVQKKVLVTSEDESSGQNGRSVSPDRDQVVGKRRRKRFNSLAAQLSTSEEEESEEDSGSEFGERTKIGEKGVVKKKVKFQESDDEIETLSSPVKSVPPVRSPSVRARKLKHDKKLKSAKLLERLKAQRTETGSDEVKINVGEEEQCQQFLDAVLSEEKGERQTLVSLAERLLFPADNAESSGSEDSDWIVSDGEDTYLDVKELLRDAGDLGGEILPYPYPPEAGDEEEEEEEMGDGIVLSDLMPPSSPPPHLPLHEAVCSVDVDNGEDREALKEALVQCKESDLLNAANSQGFTALMCAADRHDSKSAQLLLEAGASVNCRGENGASALHLAALSGCLDCVQLLISYGHVVDCTDDFGWSPILYAHFKDHEECVLALLKANPQQFSILGNILKQTSQSTTEDSKKKTLKVVRSLLVSLAHNETYYSIFNDFIADHPSILEDEGFHFMKHCMRLLSFQNKQTWFKQKLKVLREHALNDMCPPLRLHNVNRNSLLNDLCTNLKSRSDLTFWKCPFSVTFRGEAGICTGPRKEFLACLAKSLAKGDGKLFQVCDDNKLSLQACSLFYQYHCHMRQDLLARHQEMLALVGRMVAHAVFHNLTPGLHLSLPLLKQILGQPLDHPSDLEDVDKTLYHVLLKGLLEDTASIDDLELTFTQTVWCPWTARTVDMPICEGGRSKTVNETNKSDYVNLLSQFKLEVSIKEELEAFTTGFWKVLPQKCLQIFTPSELTLLLSGVPHIDTEDWQKNTTYHGLNENDEVVQWLWRLIKSLKEEEKALLLQFATGSPCLPVGGFSELQGLGGLVPFTVTLLPGQDKVPQASTCFNTLKITEYSCEQQLRNKVLIAIRYGCEGFEFS